MRADLPGGWPGDKTSVLNAQSRTEKQNKAYDFTKKLLDWRKDNEAIAKGTLKHFAPNDGVYVYERRYGDQSVIVILNGSDSAKTISLEQYAEILPSKKAKDILSDEVITLDNTLSVEPRGSIILEFGK